MLMTPPRCWRKLTTCKPYHSIEAHPPNMTDEDWDRLEQGDINPRSFVCVGCVDESERAIPQDAYRVCWVNDEVDEMGEYDEQDLTHMLAVISQALAIIAARRVIGGMVEVPTEQIDDEGAFVEMS